MKKLILIVSFFSLAATAKAEVSPKLKAVLFEAISQNVYFEDEGLVRSPEKLEDFTFDQVDEFLFEINGDSYSAWDGKVIGYRCVARALSSKEIKSAQDVVVNCTLIDENWPNH